jgi:hypothetical protein
MNKGIQALENHWLVHEQYKVQRDTGMVIDTREQVAAKKRKYWRTATTYMLLDDDHVYTVAQPSIPQGVFALRNRVMGVK